MSREKSSDWDLMLRQAFNRGNYANAYETEDYERAMEASKFEAGSDRAHAFTLGFFATYEDHEMGVHQDEYRIAYESEPGQRCVAMGLLDVRAVDPERHEEASDDAEGMGES